MIKEIGSTYWLSAEQVESLPLNFVGAPNILNNHESYVSTCRSAIGLILDTLAPNNKVALLPSFTCESVLSSFLKRGYTVYPYPIDRDLNIRWDSFNHAISEYNPHVVLVHSYFGFETSSELNDRILSLRERDIVIIEDRTQSMFSKFELPQANFYTGSIRKWMPIPDGAFVSVPYHDKEEDTELTTAKLKAFVEKGNWMLKGIGNKPDFQKKFSTAEEILNSRERMYAISSVSKAIYNATDIPQLIKVRRENYDKLATDIITNVALRGKLTLPMPYLKDGVCPFHLPILVNEDRASLQRYLASNNIFATVIWGCPSEFENTINEDARYIYDHILCFHVDQRYGQDDMQRIVETLEQYYTS